MQQQSHRCIDACIMNELKQTDDRTNTLINNQAQFSSEKCDIDVLQSFFDSQVAEVR